MKKSILVLILCGLVCIGYVYLCFKPIIIHKPYVQYKFLADSLYNPIDKIDFTLGKNKIIIYTSVQDVTFLPDNIKKWTILECRNNKTIERVKNNFVFERINNNIAETTDFNSRIFFFKNNELVFSDKFMVERSIFLHFKNTGWVLATNYNELIGCFSEFRPVYFPIIK